MTDTRQSDIEESIATERERDELRDEVERLREENDGLYRALAIAAPPDGGPVVVVPVKELGQVTAEAERLRRWVDAVLAICEDLDRYPDKGAALDLVASILRGDRPASGAQPFDPAKHSDERGTVIGGG